MDFLPPVHLHSAIALQTLAVPSTLVLCFISMLRERSIGDRDEKSLVRLYKQHAFVLELVQLFVTLMACGFVTGNTLAAFEARSLVLDFASEDVTREIIRSALVRNGWLLVSAVCILACVNMLDSWSLPDSMQDLTDPLFRLTRELVSRWIWGSNIDEKQRHYNDTPMSSLEHSQSSIVSASLPNDLSHGEAASESSYETATPPQPPSGDDLEETPRASRKHDTETTPAASSQSPPKSVPPPKATLATQNPFSTQYLTPTSSASTTAHPTAARPRYQGQTLASALRASNKQPDAPTWTPSTTPAPSALAKASPERSRTRKRSVTFAIQPTGYAGVHKDVRKRSSSVRERVRKLEDSGLAGERSASRRMSLEHMLSANDAVAAA